MVQLKNDSSETSEHSNVNTAHGEPRQLWPFLLLTIAVALVAIGAHHIQKSSSQGKCPFHFTLDSDGNQPEQRNPHIPDPLEQTDPDPLEQTDPHIPDSLEQTDPDIAEQTAESPNYDTSLYSEELVYGSKKKLADVYTGRVVTKQQLAEHGQGSENPWVAVLGHIYDVTKGMRHYGNDGTYNFFTGRDGSRAYSTGQFDEEGLTDDVSGLTVQQIGEIYHWINIFSKKYPFIGRLQGPFFTAKGKPTPQWRETENSLAQLGEIEEAKVAERKQFPSCNSHYDQGAGKAEVWCTEKSGGVSRDWVGYPRQLHLPGQRVRCACILESLLNDPKLKEYPDCQPTATSCMIKL